MNRRHRGCVWGVPNSDKCDWLVRDLGFDAVVDYKEEKNLVKAIKTAAPKGIDVFFDNVGGEQLDAGLALINVGSRVVICGAISQYNSLKPVGPGTAKLCVWRRGCLLRMTMVVSMMLMLMILLLLLVSTVGRHCGNLAECACGWRYRLLQRRAGEFTVVLALIDWLTAAGILGSCHSELPEAAHAAVNNAGLHRV